MTCKNYLAIATLMGLMFLTNGCVTVFGANVPATKFTFPNSNVQPVGQVHAEKTKWMVLFAPDFSDKDFTELYQKALEEKTG